MNINEIVIKAEAESRIILENFRNENPNLFSKLTCEEKTNLENLIITLIEDKLKCQ